MICYGPWDKNLRARLFYSLFPDTALSLLSHPSEEYICTCVYVCIHTCTHTEREQKILGGSAGNNYCGCFFSMPNNKDNSHILFSCLQFYKSISFSKQKK